MISFVQVHAERLVHNWHGFFNGRRDVVSPGDTAPDCNAERFSDYRTG